MQFEPIFEVVNGVAHRRMTAREHDVANRITIETTGLIATSVSSWDTGPDTETHYFTYDENGQKQTYRDPRNRVTTYVYDIRNRLWKTIEDPIPGSNITSRTTETLYDPAGNKVQVIFPDTTTQRWPAEDYTAFGQPRRFIDENNHTTNMEYWPWGPMKKLLSVTTHRTKDNSGGGGTEHQETTFSYDLMGRPTQTQFPDTSKEVSTYEFGQLKTWRTRRDRTKAISYDARGRETSHSWDDTVTSGVTRAWDDANRLRSIGNNISQIDYQYDSGGQLLVEGSMVVGSAGGTGSVRKQVSYYRYPSGEVSRVTYPDGITIANRAYTAKGQMQGVGWTGGKRVSYTYLRDGKIEHQYYTNNVSTTFAYNGRGMIDSVSHKNQQGINLAFREYWRDDRDRILAWKRGIDGPNGMEDGRGDRYDYDYEGQLEWADYRALYPDQATPTDPKKRDHFHYDELGNRMGSNDLASLGVVSFTRENNGLNQYKTWRALTNYDDDMGVDWGSPGHANGVLMQEGYVTASFNALNQPMAIWSPAYHNGAGDQFVWFGYDPLGRCVKRWVSPTIGDPAHAPPPNTNPATYFYYDGWNLLQEGSSGNNATRLYIHGGRVDEIVASYGGGEWCFHHYDARGHCIMLTDSAGTIREQYDYDAFGRPYFHGANGGKLASADQWGNRFLFTGREW